jgi:hypothetical protein
MHRTAQLLVERGFARNCIYDSKTRTVTIEWLPDGRQLQSLLRRLYDVPAKSSSDYSPTVLAMPVFMLLFVVPFDPSIQ